MGANRDGLLCKFLLGFVGPEELTKRTILPGSIFTRREIARRK